ncbi:hypothetical protein [Streptomyces sparsus]
MTASFAMFGTDDHPEVAEISALSEGLLSPDRSATVRSHLSDCSLCEDVRSSLEEIRSALGTLPGPTRMPEDITGRIDAALAAEALLDATAPDSVTPRTAPAGAARVTTGSSTGATSGARRVSRETEDVGTDRVSRETRRPASTSPSAGAGPGRSQRRPSRRRRAALLAVAGTVAAFSLGALFLPGLLSSDRGSEEQASDPGRSVAESSDGLSAAQLEKQVHALLAQSTEDGTEGALPQPKEAPEVGAQTETTSPLRGEGGTAGVPYCVREGVDRDEPPLAARAQTYDDTAAYLLVLPHPGDAGRVDAYVVEATCVSEAPNEPGRVLSTETFDRP